MHMISRDRDHSEGRGLGVNTVWYLSENLSDLVDSVTRPQEKFYKKALHQLKDGIKKDHQDGIKKQDHQRWRYHRSLVDLITSKVG